MQKTIYIHSLWTFWRPPLMCFWIHMDLYGPTKCLHKKVSRYILFWAQLVTNLGFASLFNYPPFQWRKHPVSQGQMVPWAFRFITFMSNSHYLPLLFCTKPLKPPDTSASGACHLGLSVPSTGKTNDLLWAKPTSFFQVAKSYIQREENELHCVFTWFHLFHAWHYCFCVCYYHQYVPKVRLFNQ